MRHGWNDPLTFWTVAGTVAAAAAVAAVVPAWNAGSLQPMEALRRE
jgi:ABC-type lipoprotein release transport system permease subunit